MERHLRQEANRAHRQEMKAERREERLHNKAVRAALHGNIGRAVELEAKSHLAHNRAEEAHRREVNARATANIVHDTHHHGHHHHPPHHGHHPPHHPHVHHHMGPRPHTDVHIVHHHHPTTGYPTGAAPPPPQPGYPGYSPGYPHPGTYPR